MRYFWAPLVLATGLSAQSVEGPVFEAASLKKMDPSSRLYQALTGGPGTSTPGRVTMRLWVIELMRKAFDRTQSEFANTEKLPQERYELEAVLASGSTMGAYRVMLRNLLIERFHLRYHTETRELKHYELQVAPGGPKIKAASGASSADAKYKIQDGYISYPAGVNTGFVQRGFRTSIQLVNATVEEFAGQFRDGWFDNPVENRTALTGKYDFVLRFTAAPNQESEASEPDLATAMREQLGLILREVKSPAEVIVIDSIDREPTPN